jgi:hypothetical protein
MYKLASETDIRFLMFFYEEILSLYPSHQYDALKDEQKTAISRLDQWIPKLIDDLNTVYKDHPEMADKDQPLSSAENVLLESFKTLNLEEESKARRTIIFQTLESLRGVFNRVKLTREYYNRESSVPKTIHETHIISKSEVEDFLSAAKNKLESFDDRPWYRSFVDSCVSIRKSDVFAISSVAAGVLYYAFKLGVLAGVSFASFGIGVAVVIGVAVIWQIFKYPIKRFVAKIAKSLTGKDPGWGRPISKAMKLTRELALSKQNNERLQHHIGLQEKGRNSAQPPVNAQQDKAIAELAQRIAEQARTITAQDKTIAEQAKTITAQDKMTTEQDKTIAEQKYIVPRASSKLRAKDREIEQHKWINENLSSEIAHLKSRDNHMLAIVQTCAQAMEAGNKAKVTEIVRQLDSVSPNTVRNLALRRPLSSSLFNQPQTNDAAGKVDSRIDNRGATESTHAGM